MTTVYNMRHEGGEIVVDGRGTFAGCNFYHVTIRVVSPEDDARFQSCMFKDCKFEPPYQELVERGIAYSCISN